VGRVNHPPKKGWPGRRRHISRIIAQNNPTTVEKSTEARRKTIRDPGWVGKDYYRSKKNKPHNLQFKKSFFLPKRTLARWEKVESKRFWGVYPTRTKKGGKHLDLRKKKNSWYKRGKGGRRKKDHPLGSTRGSWGDTDKRHSRKGREAPQPPVRDSEKCGTKKKRTSGA